MRLHQNVRKRHSVDSGIRVSLSCPPNSYHESAHQQRRIPTPLTFYCKCPGPSGCTPGTHLSRDLPRDDRSEAQIPCLLAAYSFFFFFGKECNLQAVSHRLLGFAETRQSKWDKEGYCSPMKVSHRLLRSEEAPEQGMHLHL